MGCLFNVVGQSASHQRRAETGGGYPPTAVCPSRRSATCSISWIKLCIGELGPSATPVCRIEVRKDGAAAVGCATAANSFRSPRAAIEAVDTIIMARPVPIAKRSKVAKRSRQNAAISRRKPVSFSAKLCAISSARSCATPNSIRPLKCSGSKSFSLPMSASMEAKRSAKSLILSAGKTSAVCWYSCKYRQTCTAFACSATIVHPCH